MNRRQLIKSLAFLPAIALLPRISFADHHEKGKKMAKASSGGPADLADPNEGMAKNLKYAHDATKLTDPMSKSMHKPGRNCGTCNLYNKCNAQDKAANKCPKASADKKYAPCQQIPGKVVAKTGWCISWQPIAKS